jgi:hypothetical protein
VKGERLKIRARRLGVGKSEETEPSCETAPNVERVDRSLVPSLKQEQNHECG